ncbi:hypothetical protein NC653_004870 [Populus alba x Populus x berolinensis]|uniref:Uncharacterized protein n=1 Tax=Populus alba x Populus x berolinensis TaxID=444605 RepID=A0AAD6WJU4_9ROSI|nr:hypothetical protein NC653_004870 [Populus alba x Populus x berolinensis]
MVDSDKVRVLKQKIEVLGLKCDDSCFPGQYYHLLLGCPSLMICLKNFNSKNVIFSNYCWLQYIIGFFTYRQNGAIVGCKYRTMEKRFWQVEGEIDKHSVEEAGFRNCV